MDIQDKNAVVIGATTGIGLACVKELLRNGAKKVAIIDYNEAVFETVKNAIEDEFGVDKLSMFKADITKASEFEEVFKKVIEELKTIDILHCNAGIAAEDIWRTIIDVNLTGTTHGLLMGLEHMSKNKGGKGGVIILTASILGLIGLPEQPIYSATKHAVIGLTKSFGAKRYFDVSGVRVMASCPGLTNTPILLGKNLYQKPTASVPKHMHTLPNLDGVQSQEASVVAEGIVYMIKNGVSGNVYVTSESKTHEVELPCLLAKTYKMKQVL